MRDFKKYLREDYAGFRKSELKKLDEIAKKCKPFLKKFKPLFDKGKYLYRYFDSGETFLELQPLKDRRPLGMTKTQQMVIDDYFEEKFGYRYRAFGLFASFDYNILKEMFSSSQIYLCFPEGPIDFIYSSKVSDMILFYQYYNVVENEANFAKKSRSIIISVIRNNSDRYPWLNSLLDENISTTKWYDIMRDENKFEIYFKLLAKEFDYKKNSIDASIENSELIFKCDNYILLKSESFGGSTKDIIEAIYARL